MADGQGRAARTVYVENVCSLSESHLKNALAKFGEVVRCRSKQSHAFVEFGSQQSAEAAVARGSVDAFGISLTLRRYESHLHAAAGNDGPDRGQGGRSREHDRSGGGYRPPSRGGRSFDDGRPVNQGGEARGDDYGPPGRGGQRRGRGGRGGRGRRGGGGRGRGGRRDNDGQIFLAVSKGCEEEDVDDMEDSRPFPVIPVPSPTAEPIPRPLTNPVPRPTSNPGPTPVPLQPIKILISNILCHSISDEDVKAMLRRAEIEGTFHILHYTRTEVQVLVRMDITLTAAERKDVIFNLLQSGRCNPKICDTFCNNCVQALKDAGDMSWRVERCEWSVEEEEDRLIRSQMIKCLETFSGSFVSLQTFLSRCASVVSEKDINEVCSGVIEVLPSNKAVVFCEPACRHTCTRDAPIGDESTQPDVEIVTPPPWGGGTDPSTAKLAGRPSRVQAWAECSPASATIPPSFPLPRSSVQATIPPTVPLSSVQATIPPTVPLSSVQATISPSVPLSSVQAIIPPTVQLPQSSVQATIPPTVPLSSVQATISPTVPLSSVQATIPPTVQLPRSSVQATIPPTVPLSRVQATIPPTVQLPRSSVQATIPSMVTQAWTADSTGVASSAVLQSTSPSSAGVVTSPSSADVVTSPSSAGVVTSPSSADVVTSPSSADVVTSPSSADVVTSPSSADVVTSPSSADVVTSPSSAGVVPVSLRGAQAIAIVGPSALPRAKVAHGMGPLVPPRGTDSMGPLVPTTDCMGPQAAMRGTEAAAIGDQSYPTADGPLTTPTFGLSPLAKHYGYPVLPSRQVTFNNRGRQDRGTPKYHDRSRAPLVLADIQVPLTRNTYKEKFNKLLFWEESEHMVILRDKCNGRYIMTLQPHGRLNHPTQRQGFITGISGDTIAYAMQASEGATVVIEQGTKVADGQVLIMEDVRFGVELSFQNYSDAEEKLSVILPEESVRVLQDYRISDQHVTFRVKVEFELKHMYFDGLHRSVDQLSPATIARVLPTPSEFLPFQKQPLPPALGPFIQRCSQDQRDALQTILSLPPNSPPLLVRGAFGTGKTFLLATAVHCLLQKERGGGGAVRVLVCTQQHKSADIFLECFHEKFSLATSLGQDNLKIIRLVPDGKRDPGHSEYCTRLTGYELKNESGKIRHCFQLLVVTTGGTSKQLCNIFGEDFFTHILVDEGAQLREPEAMAPLLLSGPHTRIVISGDEHQVGPNLLVLGEDARECGLKFSLLERLHHHYVGCRGDSLYEAVLTTNHRSHPDILCLVNTLFYRCNLRCMVNVGCAHPLAPFPLVFLCSSADESASLEVSNVDDHEAIVLLQRARMYAHAWPESTWGRIDYSQLCIISVGRSQLTRVAQLLKDRHFPFPPAMNVMQRLPTYDLQGCQFRAVFVSTSEPTEVLADGSVAPSNPTKSICDPFVFNTVITRAQSLVVCVGNPFLLLRLEQSMVRRYGDRGKCWSHYLKACLDHDTVDCSSVQNGPSVLQRLREAVGSIMS